MKTSQAIISMNQKIHLKYLIQYLQKIVDTARVSTKPKIVWTFVIGDREITGCTKCTLRVEAAPICFFAMNHGTATKTSSIVINACLVLICLVAVAYDTEKMHS